MFRKALVLVVIALASVLSLTGCGTIVQPVGVAVTPSPTTVDGADAVTLTATVTNDKNSAGVTWTVSGGGTLSNTTTSSATYTAPAAGSSALTVTVTATSVADTTKQGTATITVPATPAITTTGTSLAASVGAAYSVQLAGSGGISPYTWTVTAGTLPPCLSMSTGGLITGTVTAACAGTYSPVFTMTDSGTPTKLTTTNTLSMTLAAAPAISFTGAMPATGTFNLVYTGSAAATGGAGTLTYTLNSGSLPTGALLNASTGAVAGTITAAGTFNFSIKAADAYGDSNVHTYQVVVGYPAVNIAPGAGSLPVAVTGQTYSQTLTVSGGSGTGYVWNVSGLSNGLTSSASGATLTINGPATSTGTVNFTASVQDGAGNSAGPYAYSVQVYSPVTLPTSIPLSLPSTATANVAYSGTVSASGGSGNYSWNVTGQSDGITTSSSGATLTVSGTPSSAATISLNVSVKDTTTGVTAGPYTYAITVYSTVTLPAPNPTTLGSAVVSIPYSGTIIAVGGSGNYNWTVTGLPSGGLNYSATGGTLTVSGTPSATGAVSFGVSIKDNTTNTTVGPFTYSVTAYNVLTLPTPNPVSLPSSATVNAAYSGTITASGGSGTGYTYTVTGLPSNGLNYSSSGGILTISGTPTAATAVSFGVSVKDSAGLTAGPITYTVTPYTALSLPAPNPATLGPATINTLYGGTIVASGGSGNFTWTVTGLPSGGLNYSATGGTLTISGTPGAAGTVSFGVSIKDNTTNTTVGPFAYSVTVYNTLTLPTPNPSSLGAASASSPYSGSITVAGGSGNYQWTVTGLSDGLTSNTSGATLTVSGTPTSAQTVQFNVSVKDTSTNVTAGPITYSIAVYGALSLPTPNPASLPSGYTSVAYTGTVVATGGSGNYSWTVTGLPSDSLNYSATGGTLTINGTPGASPTTISFTAKVIDTTTNLSVGPFTYAVVITTPVPVTLPTPSGTEPGAAIVNQSYSGAINASGGVGPYTWSINGTTVTSSGLSLGNGTLTAYSNGGSTLSISGTPSSTGTVTLTNVKVVDSLSSNASNTYSISVGNAGGQISGQFNLTNVCGSSSLPTFTVTINTSPQQQVQTNSSGQFAFNNIPAGTYTITPSISGATSSVFYPTNYSGLLINNGTNLASQNFNAVVGYTVSGTALYTGATPAGQIYLVLNNNNCGGQGGNGTSIAYPLTSGGAYSIRGVAPGNYTLQGFLDPSTLGQGSTNASDPTGSTTVTVGNVNLTGAGITLSDPTVTAPGSNPSIKAITPNAGGVSISFGAVTNSNDVEVATFYDVNWSTSPALNSSGGSFTTVTGTTTFKAIGTNSNVWILNNAVLGSSTFTSGQTYYFQARARNSAGHPSGWTTFGGSTPTGITIGVPACTGTCYSVSGSITIPSTVTINSGAQFYAGLYNQNTGQVYAVDIAAPTTGTASPNSFTVTNVPSGTSYFLFGILDQNNDGLIDAGDVTNTRNNNSAGLAVSGNLTGQLLTLPGANSKVTVQTQFQQNTSTTPISSGYQLNLLVYEANKLPVAVTLSTSTASTPYVMTPTDMGICTTCGNEQFEYSASIPGGTPNVGDSFDFTVTYSDGSQDTGATVNGAVTGWNGGSSVVSASDAPTNLSPSLTSSTSTTPTFSWTDSSNATGSNFDYSFYLAQNTCTGNCTLWSIPGNNSNSNGFSNSITSIVWGTDPTGGGSTPSVGSLTSGDSYFWSITVQDQNGNQAQTSVNYTP